MNLYAIDPGPDGYENQAQELGYRLGDSGSRWYDDDEHYLTDIALSLGAVAAWPKSDHGRNGRTTRWNFDDGSAIVCDGDHWGYCYDPSDPECFVTIEGMELEEELTGGKPIYGHDPITGKPVHRLEF